MLPGVKGLTAIETSSGSLPVVLTLIFGYCAYRSKVSNRNKNKKIVIILFFKMLTKVITITILMRIYFKSTH